LNVKFQVQEREGCLAQDLFLPDVGSIVDTSEFPIPTPPTKPYRLRYYGGRKKRYCFKYQFWVSFPHGRILSVWGPFPGATADATIFNATIPNLLGPGELVLGDKGYQGCPHTISPIKQPRRTRANPSPVLSPWQWEYNLRLRQRRVHVERTIGRIKRFGIFCSPFRHPLEKHHLVMTVVTKIVNLELQTEPLFHGTPSFYNN
jgi:transposase